MNDTILGKTGLKISKIGFGAWGISGRDWGATDDKDSKIALHHAMDLGVTFIDTADNYGWGHSENLIAEVLKERSDREKIVIATKAGNNFYPFLNEKHKLSPVNWDFSKKHIIFATEKSLARLGVEQIDILQLHSPTLDMVKNEEAFEALEILKSQGKIKHVGWSIQSFMETEQTEMVEKYHDLIDVLQIRYNLFERQAEEKLFPVAQKYNIGVIVRIPLLFGFLTGKFNKGSKFGTDDHRSMNLSPAKLETYVNMLGQFDEFFMQNSSFTKAQLSLNFCVSHPAAHVVIPGCKNTAQVEDNVVAGSITSIKYDDYPKIKQ